VPLVPPAVIEQSIGLHRFKSLILYFWRMIDAIFMLCLKAYLKEAGEFLSAGVGLYGLGVISGFPDFVPPDPTLMKVENFP